MRVPSKSDAFTIVELLIVIVVIGILASIVMVTYRDAQARAMYAKSQDDLKAITKALALYHVDNGRYPASPVWTGQCSHDWCGWDQVTGDDFIDGLSPTYINEIPQLPDSYARENTYLYRSDGVNYQLIRYKIDGLPPVEMENNDLLATTEGYYGLAWGYKTNINGPWW